MRIFGLAAIVLFILALICAISPTMIAGAGVATWDTAGLLALALELFLPATVGGTVWRR